MKKKLWEHVKWMLEIADEDSEEKDLLLEPDASPGKDPSKTEQSVCAGVAGVTTPLGTGPTYPDSPSRKKAKKAKKSSAAAAGGSYGGAKPLNSK